MSVDKRKRDFLKKSLTVGIGLPFVGSSLLSCSNKSNVEPLRILILGGTSFLGPHQVAYAVSRGHQVTTFTRGRTKPTVNKEAFDQVESLIGDRQDNLKALENREWDVVIDNSGRVAEWTKRSAELLKDKVGLYMYVSSTGVYYPHREADVDETTPVLLEDPVPEGGTPPERDSFGVMKAKSELEAIKAFGENRATIVRPTYMVGPADRTDRFMHWPLRLEQGGDVMVPGKQDDPVQYIDVRDVAEWMIRLAEKKQAGTFNAVGPAESESIHDYVAKASTAFTAESNFVAIDDYDFLTSNRVSFIIPWIVPLDDYYASARVQNQKAIDNGLTFRPLTETMTDTLNWWKSDAVEEERREKYNANPRSILNREKQILEAWQALQNK